MLPASFGLNIVGKAEILGELSSAVQRRVGLLMPVEMVVTGNEQHNSQ